MRLSALVADLAVTPRQPGDPEITEITIDLREVTPGSLFIARRDYFGDTHAHLAAAAAQGAAAVVVSRDVPLPPGLPALYAPAEDPLLGQLAARFYGHPTHDLTVYGVTGTNGKTSVAFLLAHLLRALGEPTALMGTIAYVLPDGQRRPAVNTTPDALFVQRFAALARRQGARALVMEVSSHALALGRVAEVRFGSVGFTNLSHDHLDFHGDMAAYAAAKARLFAELPTSGPRPVAAAVCQPSDPHGPAMLAAAPATALRLPVAVHAQPPGGLWLEQRSPFGPSGAEVALHYAGATHPAHTPLLGTHNLENLALALAMVLGQHPTALPALLAALPTFPGIPGRLEAALSAELFPRGLFVDYAHTPEALDRVLTLLRSLDAGPITVVFGAGGDRDPAKRAPMGRIAAQGAQAVIITSDNPRSEAPDAILDQVASGVTSPPQPAPQRITQRRAAIAAALHALPTGPILIAGKGHEQSQEIAGHRFHFDDVACARWHVACQRHGPAQPLIAGWRLAALAATLDAPLPATPDLLLGPISTSLGPPPGAIFWPLDPPTSGVTPPAVPPAPTLALLSRHTAPPQPLACPTIWVSDPLAALRTLAQAVLAQLRQRPEGFPVYAVVDAQLSPPPGWHAQAITEPESALLQALANLSPAHTGLLLCGVAPPWQPPWPWLVVDATLTTAHQALAQQPPTTLSPASANQPGIPVPAAW